ncbi:MAG: hypothetical protein NZ524_02415 [Thiobacillaceae bacterium]|nr:hypothetical protein [Thiobacillaceae bacterium]
MRRLVLLLGALACAVQAADYAAGPADYRTHLPRLQAGDRLLLAPGDYTRGLPLHGLEGTAERPIVIEGPDSGPRARFLARRGAHTVSLVDVRHIVIRNLELDGQGLPVDAVKAEGHARYAHFVTLENLHIHDHNAHQQTVCISTKAPAYGWIVRGNLIERCGTGLYFGDSDGSAPFVAGLIERNTVRDTIGYNLQIKHQKPRPPDLPGAGEHHDTVIRHNLFDKSAGGATGPMARPNVLVGHWPLSGQGAEDRYLIYANLFWQNPTEALFQGEGNIALYNNLFVNHHGPAVRIQPHNDVPRRIDVFNNTVLARDEGIVVRLREGQAQWPRAVFDNVVLAARPLAGAEARRNYLAQPAEAARVFVSPAERLPELDLALRIRPVCALDTSPVFASLPLREQDHDGRPRTGCVPGACMDSPCPARPLPAGLAAAPATRAANSNSSNRMRGLATRASRDPSTKPPTTAAQGAAAPASPRWIAAAPRTMAVSSSRP